MSYSAPNSLLMPMRHSIDTISDSWLSSVYAEQVGSAAWPSANSAIYVPLRIPSRVVVRKLWIASHSTGTGNVDLGLFDASGAVVVTATAVAKPAATEDQIVDVTDTTVGPGLYFMACASDSSTDTFYGVLLAAPLAASMGVRSEATYPLPATATWVIANTLTVIPLMGVLLEATPT